MHKISPHNSPLGFPQIMTLAEDIDATRLGLELASARLACALELLLSAMRIHHHLDDEQVQLLRGVLCPGLPESSHGWEEAADAGLAHLIKVVLAGSSKRDAIGQRLGSCLSSSKIHINN